MTSTKLPLIGNTERKAFPNLLMYNINRFNIIIIVLVGIALSWAGMMLLDYDARWFIVLVLSVIAVVTIKVTKDPVKILLLYMAIKLTIADYFLYARSFGGIMVGIDHALLFVILLLKWTDIKRGAVILLQGRRNIRYLLLFIAFLALALLACIIGGFNGFPEGNIRSFQELFVEGFLVFAISSCLLCNAEPKTFERLLFGLIIIVGITAAYQLYVFFTGSPFLLRDAAEAAFNPTDLNVRTGGFLVNPNSQATLYNMLIPTIILLFYFGDGLFRKLLMLVLVVLMAVSYVTLASRGPLLFLVFTMIISIVIALSKHRRKLSAVALRTGIIFLICLVASFIVVQRLGDTIAFYGDRFGAAQQAYEIRSELFNATWDAIINNPFYGIGLDANNFIAAVPVYKASSSGDFYIASAHNEYLSLAISLGLLGGIIFLLIIIVSIWRLYKISNRSFEAVLVLSAIMAFGLSCNTEPVYMNGSALNNLFYLFLGTGFALCSQHLHKKALRGH